MFTLSLSDTVPPIPVSAVIVDLRNFTPHLVASPEDQGDGPARPGAQRPDGRRRSWWKLALTAAACAAVPAAIWWWDTLARLAEAALP